MIRRTAWVLTAAILLAACLPGCAGAPTAAGEDTFVFTDSSGRQVTLPRDITRVAPSGAVATMLLATIAPEYLVSAGSTPSSSQYKYLPQVLLTLPTTGQFYGSKSTLNLEALLDAAPQVVIDLGDKKDGIDKDMDMVQKQTGIPTLFIEADLAHMAEAYRTLGGLLAGKTGKAEQLAAYIEDTLAAAAANSAKISEEDRLSVMYTSGATGLNTNASGSVQSQVIPLVGAVNAVVVEDIRNSGGGNTISMEQLYLFDPDVILFATGSVYSDVGSDPVWLELSAVREGRYYEIPGLPYNWMSNPPSVNMVLGVWWLGNLLYPDVYDYDMADKTREFYSLFWGCDLAGEADAFLANSTGKN
ncbi:MAG: ABC transporter substrate-binding protein [Peptococcaceae bacterium]|jgi:iron complex transport system substrate-binding protein|nr:ABC transporter substrate-binding protein [Peptococcaceae bacterium]